MKLPFQPSLNPVETLLQATWTDWSYPTATMASQPTPNREAGRNPETLYVPFTELYDPRGEAFALRKGDPDALNYFNNWIAQQWRSGWLEERHNYWFATEEWADQVAQ